MTAGGDSWETATVLTVGDAPEATLVADLTEGSEQPYWQAWWSFTADKDRHITMHTFESVLGAATRMDTWLQVFTGADYASRVLVTEDDDLFAWAGTMLNPTNSGASWVEFDAVAGETYYFNCGSYDPVDDVVESYVVTVDWGDGPANDFFGHATPVTLYSGTYTDTVDATYATTQFEEPVEIIAWSENMTRTIWYLYEPTAAGDLRINTAGSLNGSADADTVVTIYTPNDPTGDPYVNDLELVEQEPDAEYLTDMTVALDPGTYYIQVGVWDDAGPFTLTTTFTGPISGTSDLGGSGYAYGGTGTVDPLVVTGGSTLTRHPVRTVHVSLPAPTLVDGRPT